MFQMIETQGTAYVRTAAQKRAGIAEGAGILPCVLRICRLIAGATAGTQGTQGTVLCVRK